MRQVQGLVVIAQQVHGQLDDHPLVRSHQLRVGRFIARRAALYQVGFAIPDLRPSRSARLFQADVSDGCYPSECIIHYTGFRPRRPPKVPTERPQVVPGRWQF